MFRGRAKLIAAGAALLVVGLAIMLAGCGGGGSSSSSSPTTSTTKSSTVSAKEPAASSANGPSAEFLKPNSKNKIVTFGREGSAAERKAASAVVAKSLKARETADFATQCSTLNKKGIAGVPGATGPKDCARALRKFAEPLPASEFVRKDTLSGRIDVLRVEGNRGYALWHGNDTVDWAVPLEKEGGAWKLSTVKTIEI
jgi:hypothetical protein